MVCYFCRGNGAQTQNADKKGKPEGEAKPTTYVSFPMCNMVRKGLYLIWPF